MTTNLDPLDVWSLVHFGAGLLIAYLLLSRFRMAVGPAFLLTLGVVGFWEGAEVLAGPDGFGGAESVLNLFVDIVVAVAGFCAYALVVKRGR